MASRYYDLSGGTMVHVAPHFSLCAPAYGKVGYQIYRELHELLKAPEVPTWDNPTAEGDEVILLRTSMAGGNSPDVVENVLKPAGINRLETNEDLEKLIDWLILQPETKGIVMACAVCDWKPRFLLNKGDNYDTNEFGKKQPRLRTSPPGMPAENELKLSLDPADKLIGKIRKVRKDIFLVGFKATTGMTEQEQYIRGLGLLKGASANLVLANDVHTHLNMVVTPEEAKYHVTKVRKKAIKGLCEMIALRSQLHFTRSTVIDGDPIPWEDEKVPANLRKVVNHLIKRGAYKPFQGKTVGHFATRGPKDGIIYTSRRKTNFNNLRQDGLLRIDTIGEDQVIAHGAKPSVGGQSQRIVFDEHRDIDCIVHAHVPLRPIKEREAIGGGLVPTCEQRPYECGSHECGRNTSRGLHEVARRPGVLSPPGEKEPLVSGENDIIKAVMLDEHGPNICFSKSTDPDLVIQFIEEHWDLEAKTGGPVSLDAVSY